MKENKLIDGSSGVCPLGPSGKVKAAVRKAVKKINCVSNAEMKTLNAFFESKFGISSGKLLFANSVKELIYLVTEVRKPMRVLVVAPALNIYEEAAQSVGAEVSYIETDLFAVDASSMLKHIKDKDLVFLANPNRITGKMISLKTMQEFIHMVSSVRTHFVIDESLKEFSGDEEYCHDMFNSDKFTILRTTAFFYGIPGLELAHAVSSAEITHLFKKKKQWDINILSLVAARAAYKDSAYLRTSRRFILSEKKMIIKMLHEIKWIRLYDTDTNMLLMKIDKNSDEVAGQLRRAGLDIRNCTDIIGLNSSFFRISVMKHENNLQLISALRKL